MPPNLSVIFTSFSGKVTIVQTIPKNATTIGKIREGYGGIFKNTPAPASKPQIRDIYKNLYKHIPPLSLHITNNNFELTFKYSV